MRSIALGALVAFAVPEMLELGEIPRDPPAVNLPNLHRHTKGANDER
jgi:hypothetical protein